MHPFDLCTHSTLLLVKTRSYSSQTFHRWWFLFPQLSISACSYLPNMVYSWSPSAVIKYTFNIRKVNVHQFQFLFLPSLARFIVAWDWRLIYQNSQNYPTGLFPSLPVSGLCKLIMMLSGQLFNCIWASINNLCFDMINFIRWTRFSFALFCHCHCHTKYQFGQGTCISLTVEKC